MRKLTFKRNRAFLTLCRSIVLVWMTLITFNVQSWSQCTPTSNTITGKVFEDNEVDGILKDTENGVANVLVTAYDSNGNTIGSAVSDIEGDYSIANVVDGASYRLEFSSGNAFNSTFLGEDSKSSIQFVNAPACEINYGLTRSTSSCGSNPDLFLTCFVQGEINEHAENATIISVEHDFSVSSNVSVAATQSETGSIWGITHDVINQDIYSAAFVKQYSGLKYGPYAIIKTELEGEKKTSLFVDVNTIIPQNLQGLTSTDVKDCLYGNQVGRVGLGNLIISPDSKTLYTTVLDENLVVGINMNEPTLEKSEVFAIPRPQGLDENEEFKIFALEWFENTLYVGGTVTASYSKEKKDSRAIVFALDPKSGSTNKVLDSDFLKGFWQDDAPENLSVSHWFTDISFSSTGEMIISLTDRIGHRYCKSSTNRLDQQFPDILMAAFNAASGEWELESNGMINGRSGTGVGNLQGPGGGEFFGLENWPTNPVYHSETALGSTFVLPGTDEVIVSVYDPLMNSYSGGLHRYSTLTGDKLGSIELYSNSIYPVFGKATGFGDIVARCAVQTIEIGNYVWEDANSNGLQDPGENGLQGIGLNIYDSDCNLLGSTTTDANGNYAFNSTNVDSNSDGEFDGVFPNTTYYVELDNSLYSESTGLYTIGANEYTICTSNSGTSLSDDKIDCDAVYSSEVCLEASFIEVNTTQTNHTFDIALGAPSGFDLALKKEIVGNQFARVGEEIIFSMTVYNQGGVSASEVTITDYITSAYTFESLDNPGWDLKDGVLKAKINQKLLPGTNVSKILKLKVSNAQAADYVNFAEISEALDLSGSPADDVDSTPDGDMTNDIGGEPFTNTDNQINDSGSTDEDDHDPAVPKIFDLAVRITLADTKYYFEDDVVKFDINLYNQGNVAADNVKLANYFPAELVFNSDLNQDWSPEGDYVVLVDENILAAGERRDYSIYFNISKGQTLDEILDYVEIAYSSPVGYSGSLDFDSTPDSDNTNDIGGKIYTDTDNEIDDHGLVDEDDQDPVVVKTHFVDLALMKTTENQKVKAGDIVEFTIDVINQGTAPVREIFISDYMPEGMTLADDSWTMKGANQAVKTLSLEEDLNMGEKVSTSIRVKISDNASPQSLVNYAEIYGVNDISRAIGDLDVDSTPDEMNTNDNGGEPDSATDNEIDSDRAIDEDDHDPARVIVIESELTDSECLANATDGGDGQFEDSFKVTGPSGEGWYVFESQNYYDISSPDPDDGDLVPLVNGVSNELDEMEMGNGMSMYFISVIRQDGDVGFLVLRSNQDEVETFNVAAEEYTDVVITGDLAVCEGDDAEFCIANPVDGVDYEWTVPMGAIIIDDNGTCITIDVSALALETPYEISASADDGCYAPGTAILTIGSSPGAMSCLGEMNLSLGLDCEVLVRPELILTNEITAGAAYSVMLTTQSGEVIPNATLTSAHIGTSVTAKVIDACSGNSCWSSIFVEDKMKPTIICQDVEISCNKIDEFEGPFAEDNCGEPVTVTLLNEVTEILNCDDYLAEITRTYQATDAQGNKSDECTMRLLVERVDLDDIVFPDDFLMMDGTALDCNDYDLDNDGEADIAITGVPTYRNEYVYPEFDQLCNAALTFEDKIRTINGVKKITRTWTAWEWYCSESNMREHKQYIEVRDVDAPTISCPEDITVSAVTGDCEGTVNLPLPVTMDDCSEVSVSIKTPVTGLIQEGDSRLVTFPFEGSPYTVTYTATDEAGNSSQCNILVTVKDNIAPVAICDQNTIVGLNSDGIGYTYALNIDDGSYDACGVEKIEIRRVDEGGPFGDKVIFDCDDLDGPVVVELMVTDVGGLTNKCTANVVVQDKHAPVVTGPSDMTIECGDDFLPLSQFGEFTFNDACDVTVTMDSVINITDCGTGTITRTFTASDSDGSSTESQVITIINTDPFTFDDIISFPLDTTLVINTCDVDGITSPEALPDGYNYPVFNDDLCDQVSAGFHDEKSSLFDDPNSVCFVIVRTWTIIDWCQKDINGNPAEFEDIQIIKVVNEKEPDPIVISPMVDTISSTVCDSAMVTFTATSGDCAPNEVQSLIQIDIDSDFITTGTYEISLSGTGIEAEFAQMLPIGSHTVVVTFRNACGKMVTTSFPLFIKNDIPPNILCQATSVGLEPWDTNGDGEMDTEAACVDINSFIIDSGTFHPCDVDFYLSFSLDSLVTEMCFDCDDIGLQEVTIYAIDIFGNSSSCDTEIDVQDNNDFEICINPKDCTSLPESATFDAILGVCNFTISGTALDPVQNSDECGELTFTYSINNVPSGNSLDGVTFPIGITIVTWTITDGNQTATCTQNITVNPPGPAITCPGVNGVVDIDLNSESLCEYTAAGLDPFAITCEDDFDLTYSYTGAAGTDSGDGSINGIVFPEGTTTVTYTVDDGNGTASCSFDIIVTNSFTPEIECPDDVTLNLWDQGGPAKCFYIITSDDLDADFGNSCNPDEFSVVNDFTDSNTLLDAEFQLGTTTVTWMLLDESGATVDECSFEIVVVDDINPSISCAADATVNDAADGDVDCKYTVDGTEFDPISVSDNCGVASVVNDINNTSTLAGEMFDVGGPYTVTWTVTDDAGLSSTCTFDITVVDTQAPECIDQGEINVDIGGGMDLVLTTDLLPETYTDACGIASVIFEPATLSCDLTNPITVNVVVTDINGNEANCPVIFIITPDENISCELNEDVIYLDANGNATIDPESIVDISGGGCGIDYVPTLSQTTFDCTDVSSSPITLSIFANDVLCGMDQLSVLDTISPVISCAVSSTQGTNINAAGDASCSFTVSGTLFDATATDACGIATLTNDITNTGTLDGAEFSVAGSPHTINWTATDANGNTDVCSFVITVEDDDAPVCGTTTEFDVTIAGGETITINENDFDFGFTDNCGITSVTFDPATLDCTLDSPVNVTATLTDANNNTTECPLIFNIIIDDEVSCAFSVDTVYLNADGEFLLNADIITVSGGVCGVTPNLSVVPGFTGCNNVGLGAMDFTILVNGEVCSVDQLVTLDTLGPAIICNTPIEISCADYETDFGSDLDAFLENLNLSTVVDNCPTILEFDTIVDASALDACGYGILTRTITVSDSLSGLTDMCTQTITINGPQDILTEAELASILPDTVTITDCNGGTPDIDVIVQADLEALVDCGQFLFSFMDVSAGTGCPDTITRTYTVNALCQSEILEFVQIIIVDDQEAPTVDAIADIDLIVNPASCMAILDMSGAAASDNCSTELDISYSYEGNGPIDINTTSALEVGTYNVTVTAADACDNVGTEELIVTVTDTSDIVVSCLKVQIPIDTMTLSVDFNINDGISVAGNCGGENIIFATYTENDFGDSIMTFGCVEVEEPALPIIFIYEVVNGDTIPFDISPNVPGIDNTCKVEIEVLDPTNACGNTIFNIGGEVTTIDGHGIPEYSMTLYGSGLDAVMSDEVGEYAFPKMPIGGNYKIGTYNNNGVMNGVSTLDLIIIQRHILGLAELESPYQYIAADINNSESITSTDLLALRKMILGVNINFPNNTSWRTVDASYEFIDETDPWAEGIPEDYTITDLGSNMDIDFIGVKVGDVNGSVSLNAKSIESSSTRSGDVVFNLDIEGAHVRFLADELMDIAGLQFTLNTYGMTIANITSEVFDANQIGFYKTDDGVYNISIAGINPIAVGNEETFIDIEFDCMDCKLGELKLGDTGLSPEAYLTEGLLTTPFEIEIRDMDNDDASFEVVQNNPNPWTINTSIQVRMAEAGNVTISVFDVNGRLIYNSIESMANGMNTIELDDSNIKGSGVFYYEISTSVERAQYKMIKLK